MRRQACLIIPGASRDDANTLAALMGYDNADPPNTYNIPLVPIGEAAPTHWATSTPVTAGFEAMIVAAKQGDYTIIYPELVPLASTVIAGLIADFVDIDSETAPAQLARVAAANGLERWMPEMETDGN